MMQRTRRSDSSTMARMSWAMDRYYQTAGRITNESGES
jgi:hypothetical protein